jgi:hypothetical protein
MAKTKMQIAEEIVTMYRQIKMELKLGKIKTEREYYNSPEMQKEYQDSYRKVFSTDQPFERVSSEPCTSSFCGRPFKYQRFEESVDFGEVFKPGDSLEDSVNNFRKISTYIVRDIEKMFGSLNRITDVAVVSDILIFNGVSYEPKLPDIYINHLPIDIQYAVREGQFAWVFDFAVLKSMPNLTNLMFDNTDFLFRKVRIDLTERRNFEPKHFFIYFKKLTNLQVGQYTFTRNSQDSHDDIFHKARRATEIADAVDSWAVNLTKNRWISVRNFYNNPKNRGAWKLGGSALQVGVALATSVGTGTFKTGRFLLKHGTGLLGSINDVLKEVKDNL